MIDRLNVTWNEPPRLNVVASSPVRVFTSPLQYLGVEAGYVDFGEVKSQSVRRDDDGVDALFGLGAAVNLGLQWVR